MKDTRKTNDNLHDANIKMILTAAVVLVLLILVGAGIAWVTLQAFNVHTERRFAGVEAIPRRDLPRTGPKLQVRPMTDINELNRAQAALLNGYEWVDPNEGVVRIPIERAMEILAAVEAEKRQ